MRTSRAAWSGGSQICFQAPRMFHLTDCSRRQISSIWEFAKSESFSIVTADADFYELATALGPPPKVIWLRGCDYPTVAAEKLERIHDRCTQSHISKVLISLRNQHPVPCLSGHSYRGFALIRGQAIRIVEFLEDPERAVLILQKR
jgi:predicted nuclease of predicted toxin-antitoxin system